MDRQRLKCSDNQCVSGQYGNALAKFGVDRRFAPSFVGIVKTGEVIVNQRGAVKKFHRRRCRCCQRPVAAVVGKGDCHAELRSDPGTAGENRMLHRLGQQRGALCGHVLREVSLDIVLAVK
jgi:hypothetical protein